MTNREIEIHSKKLDKWIKLIKFNLQTTCDSTPADSLTRADIQDFDETVRIGCLSDLERSGSVIREFIDWLLTEAEYCSHMFLMAHGNVLVHPDGYLENQFLWAPPGHTSLLDTDQPGTTAEVRLNMVFQTLQLLSPSCQQLINRDSEERYRRVTAVMSISSAMPDEKKGFISLIFPMLRQQSFLELVADSNYERCLHRFGYVEIMQRLLEKTTGLHWNLGVFGGILCGFEEVRSMIDQLEMAKSLSEPRLSSLYLAMCHKAFDNLCLSKKNYLVKYFYEKYGLVTWHDYDEQFENHVLHILSILFEQRASKDGFRQALAQMYWYFMISVECTWLCIMVQVLRHREMIPAILMLIRHFPFITNFRSSQNGSLIVVALAQYLILNTDLTKDNQSNLVHLFNALFAEVPSASVNAQGQRIWSVKAPILSSTNDFWTLIVSVLPIKPQLAVNLLAAILNGRGIVWSVAAPGTGGHSENDVAKLLLDLLTIITQSASLDVIQCGVWALKLLFSTWEIYDLVFPEETIEQLKTGFQQQQWPWTLKAFVFWSLNDLTKSPVRIPLPDPLMDTLGLSDAEYEMVIWNGGNESKLDSAVTQFFELATVSIEMAIDLSHGANMEKLKGLLKEDIREPFIIALSRTLLLNPDVRHWQNCVDLLTRLVDRLWNENEAVFDEAFQLKSVSIGAQQIAAVVKVFEAMERIFGMIGPTGFDAFVKNLAVILRDAIIERILSCDNILAKFTCLASLCEQCKRLKETSGNSTLSTIFQQLEQHKNMIGIALRETMKDEEPVARDGASSDAAESVKKEMDSDGEESERKLVILEDSDMVSATTGDTDNEQMASETEKSMEID